AAPQPAGGGTAQARPEGAGTRTARNAPMSAGIPDYLTLPPEFQEACAAACACANAAGSFHQLAQGMGNPVSVEAEWAAEAAKHLASALQCAAGPVAKAAGRLAATSVGAGERFGGLCDSSYHVTALELGS